MIKLKKLLEQKTNPNDVQAAYITIISTDDARAKTIAATSKFSSDMQFKVTGQANEAKAIRSVKGLNRTIPYEYVTPTVSDTDYLKIGNVIIKTGSSFVLTSELAQTLYGTIEARGNGIYLLARIVKYITTIMSSKNINTILVMGGKKAGIEQIIFNANNQELNKRDTSYFIAGYILHHIGMLNYPNRSFTSYDFLVKRQKGFNMFNTNINKPLATLNANLYNDFAMPSINRNAAAKYKAAIAAAGDPLVTQMEAIINKYKNIVKPGDVEYNRNQSGQITRVRYPYESDKNKRWEKPLMADLKKLGGLVGLTFRKRYAAFIDAAMAEYGQDPANAKPLKDIVFAYYKGPASHLVARAEDYLHSNAKEEMKGGEVSKSTPANVKNITNTDQSGQMQ